MEELDLIERRLCIARRRLDDLERDVSVHFCILCEPDGGEMAPTELADDDVAAIGELVTNVDGVIATGHIVFPVLFLAEIMVRRLIRLVRRHCGGDDKMGQTRRNPRDESRANKQESAALTGSLDGWL